MEQLGVLVGEFFYFHKSDVNNNWSILLGSEGSRILMAHPVGGMAMSTTYIEFKASVQALFEHAMDPAHMEF